MHCIPFDGLSIATLQSVGQSATQVSIVFFGFSFSSGQPKQNNRHSIINFFIYFSSHLRTPSQTQVCTSDDWEICTNPTSTKIKKIIMTTIGKNHEKKKIFSHS
jgi:hypothetical protein